MKRICFLLAGLVFAVSTSVILTTIYKEYVLGLIVGCMVVCFLVATVKMFLRSEHDVRLILEAVKNNDTTLRFNKKLYPGKIGEMLNEISEVLHDTRLSMAQNQTYFSSLLNRVPSGVFVADSLGKIITVNTAFLNMIGLPAIASVSRISEKYPLAAQIISNLSSGESSTINLADKNLAVSCSKIIFPDRGELFIYVLTDIDSELSRSETDAWTMSVRTLSHEIMNTITPIISISDTLASMNFGTGVNQELKEGLSTISAIGEKLMQFAGNYRALAHAPQPSINNENLEEIINEIYSSVIYLPDAKEINFILSKNRYFVKCDRNLTYTAIANILKNAIDAVKDLPNGEICMECVVEANGYVRLDISNNGTQIPKEICKDIFSPFFTTKLQGQGIGLPLSKRIMVSQGGNLYLKENSLMRTTFSLNFLQA